MQLTVARSTTRPFTAACKRSPRRFVVSFAQKEPATPAPAPAEEALPAGYRREYDAFGSRVIETAESIKGPEDEKDFWEGENFENFGKIMEQFFLPGMVVLGLIVGGVAAGSYNEGADTFIKSPTGPDAQAEFIPAAALATPAADAPAVASE